MPVLQPTEISRLHMQKTLVITRTHTTSRLAPTAAQAAPSDSRAISQT